MNVTDSPHRAGTPEHDEWVRTVYIPAVSGVQTWLDARRVGARSIGARLARHGRHRYQREVRAMREPRCQYPLGMSDDGQRIICGMTERMGAHIGSSNMPSPHLFVARRQATDHDGEVGETWRYLD